MNRLPLSLLLTGMALTLSTGCSLSSPVVRAQNPATGEGYPPPGYTVPANYGPVIGTAPGYGQFKRHPTLHQDFAPLHANRNPNFGYYDNSEYSQGQHSYGGEGFGNGYQQSCPPGYGGSGGHHFPHHYSSHRYDWPQNMVYPTTGAPNAAVAYPYYTLRGPTDFFMK